MTTTQYTRTGPKILYQEGDRVLATYAPTSRYAGLPAQPATVISQYTRIEDGVERVTIQRDSAAYPERWDAQYLQLA